MFFRSFASLILLGMVLAGAAAAQPRRALPPGPGPQAPHASDFGAENEKRVAASPAQIREVLAKNPGLLVELKKYIAREATANGQILDDSDLSEQSIFERLDDDILFRAAATRILQHYGYLLPDVNPDSELGRQQDLVLKERARRLVQIEAQEDGESVKPQSKQQTEPSLATDDESCNPRETEAECRGPFSQERHGRELSSPPELPDNSPETPRFPSQVAPSNRSPLLQAGLSGGGNLSQTSLDAGDSSDLLRAAAMNSLREPLSPQITSTDAQRIAGMLKNESSSPPIGESDNPGSPIRPRDPYTRFPRTKKNGSSLASDPDTAEGDIVHTHNPYSDVPSLYDLYVQVAPQNREPRRFGVETLRTGRESSALPMDLPVDPDYVLGPGDGLSIDLWGGISQRLQRVVDREGRISLPESGPLLVSGRTLGDVQFTVQQLLRTQYRDVSADVSLSRLRTVRIYVVGEVPEPGAYNVSSLSSALNALIAAGGITERGSLRAIKHFRGKQLIEVIDAYDLLLRGMNADQKRLESGDSLLVPPVGPQITIEGMVRRPAIYELHGEDSLESALELAGGILPAAALKHVEVERLVAHQNRTMFSLDLSSQTDSTEALVQLAKFQIQDGDKIHIFPIAPYNDRAIYLEGHVLRPGRYSYSDGMTVKDLISSYADLLPEPAESYAEIIRLNPPNFRPTMESFDLAAALQNPGAAPPLEPLDTVRIFGRYDFEPPPEVWVGGEVHSPGPYATSGQARLRDAVYLAGGVTFEASLDSAQLLRTTKDGTMKIMSVNLSAALAGNPAENPVLQPHDRIVIHRNSAKVDPPTVYVKGDVAKPGRYPLTSNMHVEDLVRVAGGLKRSADQQTALLAHRETTDSTTSAPESIVVNLHAAMAGADTENKLLSNGDVLTIRQNPNWNDLGASVTLRGEVQHPGVYGIGPGETLSSVLQKAGGFTGQAYPYGIVLTRRSVRDLEVKSRQELVDRLKAEQVQLKALPENDPDQKNLKLTALAETETTLTQLETNLPVGRVVIHSSPDAKTFEHVAAETPLRPGDVILVPQKPTYVLVQGQVFNATAVGFVADRSANWYLSQAGGLTQLADKKAVFVIRADGSVLAAKNNGTMWSGNPLDAVLMPGDMVVVPEKAPKIGSRNWIPLIQSAQVASSIAIAIAYFKP